MIYWPIYPQFLRDLFTKAFTTGIRDPKNGRVRESEWRTMMVRLRDSIIYCEYCGLENFYDIDLLKMVGKLNPLMAQLKMWHRDKASLWWQGPKSILARYKGKFGFRSPNFSLDGPR